MNDNIFVRFWSLLHFLAGKLHWLPPTLARLTIGLVFIGTGWGKLHNLDKITAFFMQLGIPAARIQAPMVSFLEFSCGIAVLIGFLTRLTALPLIGIMIVAILTAKLKELTGLNDLFGTIEWLYLVLLIGLHITGPGPISVDQLLLKDKK
jgi:putative oxidoreductase